MGMWTAIMVIVVVAIIAEAVKHTSRSKSASTASEELQALRDRIDQLDADLRQRVETLERIVTDDKDNLKRQFEDLERRAS